MKAQSIIAGLLALTVTACAGLEPGNRTGVCQVFQGPSHVIRGANKPSQRWIDTTIERGIAVCGWDRPRIVK
jgi:hypothetical protein